MRAPIAIVTMMSLLAVALTAGQGPRTDDARMAQQAVDKVLPLLQQSARTWSTRAPCLSCHHQGLGATAVALARERGYHIDDTLFAAELATIKSRLPRPEQSVIFGTTDLETVAGGYVLMALAAGGTAGDTTTDAILHRMLGRQYVSGYWSNRGAKRLPLQGSTFSDTALTLRAIRLFSPAGRKADADRQVQRARAWLEGATPNETEDAAMQLLGLAWSGGGARDIERAKERLRKLQRPDGGWAQIPSRESDAYATGQVLVALNQAGRVPPTDAAYRKGVAFLLRTQKPDGTWLVETRRTWRQGLRYFESGFPYGKHQFLSYAATAWATMALTLSARDQVSRVLMGDPGPRAVDAPPPPVTTTSAGLSTNLTPLMRAALVGSREDVQRLLRSGADVNEVATPLGITALMCAVHDPEKVTLLLAAGATVNAAARTGHTALLLAADYDGARESIQLLLDGGADIKARTSATNTAMARAALRGDREALSLLARRGGALNDLPTGSAAMAAAAHEGDSALIAFLLDQGANIETTSRLGRERNEMTPLMLAADNGQLEAVRLLLARGGNVNARDGEGMTPIFYAIGALDFGATRIVEALIKAGADIQQRTTAGESPLDFAQRYGNTQAADVLQKVISAAKTDR